jgi:POT family proton-dependent oligopeptide transporter
MDRTFHIGSWSLSILPSQVQAVNAVLILLFVPLFTAGLFPWLRRKGWEPKPLRLIGIGLFLTAASFAVMSVLAGRMYDGQSVHISGQLLAYVLLTAAEVLVSMTCLEFAYTQAPNAAKSLVMGLYFLSFALGNFMAVEVNHFMAQPVYVQVTEEGFLQLPGEATLRNERQVAFGRGTDRQGLTASGDTLVLQGSFLMRETDMDRRQFALREPRTRESLVVLPSQGLEEPILASLNRLAGPWYFLFFTGLMLVAALAYIPLAIAFKPQTVLQAMPEEVMGPLE